MMFILVLLHLMRTWHLLPTFGFSLNTQINRLDLFSAADLFFFSSLMPPVGGDLVKCLRILHPCNTNQVYSAHNVCTVYSRACWTCTEWQSLIYQHINIVACNIAQYVCNYMEKRLVEPVITFNWIKVIFNILGTR